MSSSDEEDYSITYFGDGPMPTDDMFKPITYPDDVAQEAAKTSSEIKNLMLQDPAMKALLEETQKKREEWLNMAKNAKFETNESVELVFNKAEQKVVDDLLRWNNPNSSHVYAKMAILPDASINPAMQLIHHWHAFKKFLYDRASGCELGMQLCELLYAMDKAGDDATTASAGQFDSFLTKHLEEHNPSALSSYRTNPLEYFTTIMQELSKALNALYMDKSDLLEGAAKCHEHFVSQEHNSWFSEQLVSMISAAKRCTVCDIYTTTWSHVWNITVKIPLRSQGPPSPLTRQGTRQELSLGGLIEKQFQDKFRSDVNSGPCEQCTFNQADPLCSFVERPPPMLLVHMPRALGNKFIDYPVAIDRTLQLFNLVNRGQSYRLLSCIYRTGKGYGVMVFDNIDESKCFCLMDSKVVKFEPSEVFLETQGEVFMYKSITK